MNPSLRFILIAIASVSLTAAGYASAPLNDKFANATNVPGTSASVSGTTIGASVESGEPSNSAFFDGASVWWKWTPAANGTVTFTTYGIGFDHEIDVWAGAAVGSLNFVAGSTGNACSGTKFSFSAAKNVTYYIQVEGVTNGSTAGPNFTGTVHSGTVRFALFQGTFAAPTVDAISGISGVATGQTMTFNSGASAAGSQTLVYQWYQTDTSGNSALLADGSLSSGETVSGSATAAIKLGNMPLSANQNQVTLVVSNSDGSGTAVADPEQTSVFFSDEQIVTQPTGATSSTTTNISGGGTASFTVVATGGPLPGFQWRKGTTNVGSGVQSSGSTFNVTNSFDNSANQNTSTLTITNAGTGDNGSYSCVVSNTTTQPNSDTTTGITLTVTGSNKAVQTPAITSASSTTFGATYTSTATGFGTASWSLGTGSTASGASINSSSGVISYASVGTVVVKVSFSGDSTHLAGTSADFTITVNKAAATFALNNASFTYTGSPQGPTVVATPSNATFTSGGTTSATSAGSYNATATATGNYSGTNSSLGWTIGKANQSAPAISSGISTTFGSAYTATVSSSGTGALSWALGTGSTAAGAAINATSGAISYTAVGTVVIKATFAGDANHNAATTANFTVTVGKANQAAPVISSPATATVGSAYTATANSGSGALSWALGTGSTAAGAAINATSGGVSFTAAGSVVIKATFAGDANHNAATSANFTITVSAGTSSKPPVADFDADGKNDLIWTNTSTGDRAIWFMNGTSVKEFGYIAGIDPAWHIVGVGDFNADGKPDLVWENLATGDRTFWQMNGIGIDSFGYLAYVDGAWHIAAIGDFNGDGKPDVIWENTTTGDRAIWFLDGQAIGSFGYIAGIDPAWHIVGAADLDGDGQTDLVWENLATGDRTIWYMNGATLSSFGYIANIPGAWHIASVMDIDGDGHADLVWENTTTGDRAIWLMNNAAQLSAPYLAYVDPVWNIAP